MGEQVSHWVRLWSDMPTDPKWRVIARRSGRPLSEVIAVFVFMMTNAGANATERGTLSGWNDEDVAAGLDLDAAAIIAIREAMQGKTLQGDRLTGWEVRQPKREDNSADRAKAWREKNKKVESVTQESERNRTQENAGERPDADADAEQNNSVLPDGCPKPQKRQRTRIEYSERFEAWWKSYPTDPNMSKSEAYGQWKRLSSEDQDKAEASIPAFLAYCKSDTTYRPIHAERFLAKRRFDGFAKQAEANSSMIFVKVGTAQFDAWNAYLRDTKGKGAPNHNGGWRFPSEWPPNHSRMAPH